MLVVKKETNRTSGKQTLVRDGDRYYLVTSIKNPVVDKTFIVKCNEKYDVKDWNESFTVIPSDHEAVLKALEEGTITANDFNFEYGKN